MPFDGREYQTALPLGGPITAHSSATATGDALAGAARSAMHALRWRARMIGQQTYPIYQRFLRSNGIEVVSFPNLDFVDVARFEDVQIPYWATHIVARLSARIITSAPLTIYARVNIDNGVDQDTGDPSEVHREPVTGYPHRVIFSVWSGEETANITCAVPIVDARVSPGPLGSRTVVVQCYAITDASVAQEVQPGLVTAWWECRG